MDPSDKRGSYREDILSRYDAAKRRNPKLTKGQFMVQSNPGTYANEDSGRRQFAKLESGEISGERLFNRSHNITHYRRTKKVAGVQQYEPVREKRHGGYEYGLWKVILTLEYTDQDGQIVQEDRSYIVSSNDLDSNYDIPLIDDLTAPADEDYLSYWQDTGSTPYSAEIVGKQVIRIERTNKPRELRVLLD